MLATLALSLLLGPHAGAIAACAATGGSLSILAPSPLSISTPSNSISPGQPVSSGWSKEQLYNDAFTGCQSILITTTLQATAAPIAGLYYYTDGNSFPVYATGVPGIGFVIFAADPNQPWKPMVANETLLLPPGNFDLIGIKLKVFFVTTGKLVAGYHTMSAKTVGIIRLKSGSATFLSQYITLNSVSFSVATPGCTIDSKNQVVKLDPVLISQFKGIGTYAGKQPFSLSLRCDPSVNIYITLTDGINASNRSSSLGLASRSTASGVGVQILRAGNTTPISFGPDSPNQGTVNQWRVGPSGTGGTVSIPLEARYVKNVANVMPGAVEALATFTMSYQ